MDGRECRGVDIAQAVFAEEVLKVGDPALFFRKGKGTVRVSLYCLGPEAHVGASGCMFCRGWLDKSVGDEGWEI